MGTPTPSHAGRRYAPPIGPVDRAGRNTPPGVAFARSRPGSAPASCAEFRGDGANRMRAKKVCRAGGKVAGFQG